MNSQYGLVKGKNTKQAISADVNNLGDSTKRYRAAAFLDIKEAFDGVWWQAVVVSLKAKNEPGSLIKIMRSYLDRTLERKCPQSSKLGPNTCNLGVDKLGSSMLES